MSAQAWRERLRPLRGARLPKERRTRIVRLLEKEAMRMQLEANDGQHGRRKARRTAETRGGRTRGWWWLASVGVAAALVVAAYGSGWLTGLGGVGTPISPAGPGGSGGPVASGGAPSEHGAGNGAGSETGTIAWQGGKWASSKDILVCPEGMQETRTYALLQEKQAPFRSYVPDHFVQSYAWMIADGSQPAGNAGAWPSLGATMIVGDGSGDAPVQQIKVVFLQDGTSEAAAKQAFANELARLEQAGGKSHESYPRSWSLADAMLTMPGTKGANGPAGEQRSMVMLLGQHGNHYFYVEESAPQEYGDGFAVIKHVFESQWQWRDGTYLMGDDARQQGCPPSAG